MKLPIRCVLLFFLILSLVICTGWGFFGHKRINRYAVFILPPEMLGFYKANLDQITESAVNPDRRRFSVVDEAPRHYIDLDHYGDSALSKLPDRWKDAGDRRQSVGVRRDQRWRARIRAANLQRRHLREKGRPIRPGGTQPFGFGSRLVARHDALRAYELPDSALDARLARPGGRTSRGARASVHPRFGDVPRREDRASAGHRRPPH